MKKQRWQFSLRTLLIATSILAVLTAMLANYMDVMIAIALFALWLLDGGSWLSWYFSPLNDRRPLKTSKEMRTERLPENSKKLG